MPGATAKNGGALSRRKVSTSSATQPCPSSCLVSSARTNERKSIARTEKKRREVQHKKEKREKKNRTSAQTPGEKLKPKRGNQTLLWAEAFLAEQGLGQLDVQARPAVIIIIIIQAR